MEGSADAVDLAADLHLIPEILLYAGPCRRTMPGLLNKVVPLQPHSTNSAGAGLFLGPEIGFGERMRELCPGEKVALVKYAYDGSNLHTQWNPGADASDTGNWGVHFTEFVNTVNRGMAALEAEGWDPEIKGMLWVQGEADATAESSGTAYGTNLVHLIARVREQFAANASPGGIRFVAGQVLPRNDTPSPYSNYRTEVRQAILDVDENSGAPLSTSNTGAVPTNHDDHPTRPDKIHFTAAGVLPLGRSMAYKMLELEEVTYTDWSLNHGLSGGQGDDDDKDGLPNLLEFALGGNPTDPSDAPRPGWALVDDGGTSYPAYVLQRDLGAADVTLEAMFSPDLVDWTSEPAVFVSSVRQLDGTAILTFRGPWPLDDPAHPRGFFRSGVAMP
jgi:hypothetical protein